MIPPLHLTSRVSPYHTERNGRVSVHNTSRRIAARSSSHSVSKNILSVLQLCGETGANNLKGHSGGFACFRPLTANYIDFRSTLHISVTCRQVYIDFIPLRQPLVSPHFREAETHRAATETCSRQESVTVNILTLLCLFQFHEAAEKHFFNHS